MSITRWLAWGGLVGTGAYWLMRYLRPEHSQLILENSVVLITGASSGIGQAYADAFARRGTKIVLAARRVEKLDEVRQQIAPYAADVLTVPTDVNDEAQLRALVDQTLATFGQIDVLINNAGIAAGGPLHTIAPQNIKRIVDTNLTAVMTLTHLVLPAMLSRRSGTIVNIASIVGQLAMPSVIPYMATKHAIIAFSTGLRRELEGTGVNVVTVLPSWTRTEIISPELEKRFQNAGTSLDTAEYVANRTIEGILKMEREIYFGDRLIRLGMWMDRHFPGLMNLYWRGSLTPNGIHAMRE